MRGQAPISPVYRMGEPEEQIPDTERWARGHRVRREAWKKHGIVMVEPGELPEGLRVGLKAWAAAEFGER